MAVKQQGSSRQQHDVKVKFIETQFISSDAASFKAVVQQLTGKSSHAPAPAPPQPQRPRPCRPAFPDDAGSQQKQRDGYSAHQQSGNNGHHHQHHLIMPQRLEELYELCDFSDLLYGGGGFPN